MGRTGDGESTSTPFPMRFPSLFQSALKVSCFLVSLASVSAAETVATAVYARVGNGYQREALQGGAFKPEYYALSNGGRVFGTAADETVDRVTYPEVAAIAMRLLARQNYYYAQSKEQAKLLIVLQWGNTIAPNQTNYSQSVGSAAAAYADLVAVTGPQGPGSVGVGMTSGGVVGIGDGGNADPGAADAFESALIRLFSENRARDQINELNSKVLGYFDELNESNDIRRWAGGGDRYNDLIADVEETRYFMVISAYDFPELERSGKKKLLWQTRVSVRSPGNTFDNTVAAMLKSASKHFGQDNRRLIRDEETKGTVEMRDLEFLGEAKEGKQPPSKKPVKDGS